MPKMISPVDVTPGTENAWVDVDVSAHVGADAGNLAGVILQVKYASTATQFMGFRKNGSSDDQFQAFGRDDNAHGFVYVGVDSGDIFECRVFETANLTIWLVGYILTDEATFQTNETEHNPGSTSAWGDVDLASQTGAETALVAFFRVDCGQSGAVGLRPNGSTDDRKSNIATSGDHAWAHVGLDGNEVCELYRGTTGQTFWLQGWLHANATVKINAVNYQTGTTGSWVDTDVSADVGASDVGVLVEFFTPNVVREWGLRAKGETVESRNDLPNLAFGAVKLDGDDVFQQWIEDTSVDLFLNVAFSEPTAGGQDLVKVHDETEEISEDVVRSLVINRILNETEQVTENLVRALGLTRLDADTEEVAEAIVRAMGLARDDADTVQLSESVIRTLGITASQAETEQLTETVIRVLGKVREDADAVEVTETVTRLLSLVRLRAEVIQLSETITTTRALSRIVNETVQVADDQVRPRTMTRVLDEALQVVEDAERKLALVRLLFEGVNMSEAIEKLTAAQPAEAVRTVTAPAHSLTLTAPSHALRLTV